MFKKITSIILAAVIIALCIPFSIFAADTKSTTGSTFFGSHGVKPVPLLVIVVSYSNQATRSEESYWGNSLFGDNGNTMKNYFKLMSGSKFWFTPAEETYGTKNNGVVYVKLDENHPNTSGSNSTNIGTTKSNALEAASKYVDFSKFDTNGDKVLSWQELSIVYVIAGRSTKFGMANDGISKYAIGSYKTNYTYTKFLGYIIYDVKVGSISFGDSYAVVGEMQSSRQPLTFGSIAHELCHVIGAKDLYTYSGYTWCGGPGDIAMQGGGSGLGSQKGVTSGNAPSAIDPYYLIKFGFREATEVRDGIYTLYSRESTEGGYNIIKISTNNPKEYYLIENRYTVRSSTYDAISPASRGIQIWHVDETIMQTQSLPNCWKGTAHAPGLTPLYPNGATGGNGYDSWYDASGKNTFECRKFKFAGSNTWHTRMTDAEANDYNFKVTILSGKGNEMRIQISGFGNLNCDHVFDSKNTASVYLFGKATCTRQATYFYSCSKCGQKGTRTFAYGELLAHNFTARNAKEKYLASEATCTEQATYFYSCSECGEKGADTFAYGSLKPHDYSTEWTSGADMHWHACTACGAKSEETAHSFDKKRKCTVCGSRKEGYGDLNGDGKVGAADLTLMRRYIAGYYTGISAKDADLDGDGKVGAADLTIIRRMIAGYEID